MQKYSLADLQTYVAVVEAGGFHKAATRMGSSIASVSRRVASLERALNTCLLQRTTRAFSITEEGEQFYNDIAPLLNTLAESEDRIKAGQQVIKGKIRMVAPLTYSIVELASVLPEFIKRHPLLHIELKAEDQESDVVGEHVDIALRISKTTEHGLCYHRIRSIPRLFCASLDYIEEHGRPKTLADLSKHKCLHYTNLTTKSEWGTEASSVHIKGQLSANNGDVLLTAAEAGLGIATFPEFIARKALEKGTLVEVLENHKLQPLTLFAAHPNRQYVQAKIRLLIEFLLEQLGDEKTLFSSVDSQERQYPEVSA